MATLTEQQKLFVVQRIACYHTLTEVCELLKQEYGVVSTTAQLARYNPATLAGATLGKPLKEAFDEARIKFRADTESIAIAQKNFRLRELEVLYRYAREKNVARMAAAFLEQAAKEEGGLYTRPQKDISDDGQAGKLLEEFTAAIEKVYGSPAVSSQQNPAADTKPG